MKNYNDIFVQQSDISHLVDAVYSKGYDKACEDCKEDDDRAIEEAYQKGLTDVWKCASKVWNMTSKAREKVFNTDNVGDVFCSYSASEAIEKVKEWETEQEDKFIIGDEIVCDEKDAVKHRYVIVAEFQYDYRVIDHSCMSYIFPKSCKWKKTGRHFDIQGLINQMNGRKQQ